MSLTNCRTEIFEMRLTNKKKGIRQFDYRLIVIMVLVNMPTSAICCVLITDAILTTLLPL